MSVDYTHDYSDHVLLDNKNKYTELYKLSSSTAADVNAGDLLLLKTACGRYGMFVALSAPEPDGTLHLSKYSEVDFIKLETDWLYILHIIMLT